MLASPSNRFPTIIGHGGSLTWCQTLDPVACTKPSSHAVAGVLFVGMNSPLPRRSSERYAWSSRLKTPRVLSEQRCCTCRTDEAALNFHRETGVLTNADGRVVQRREPPPVTQLRIVEEVLAA